MPKPNKEKKALVNLTESVAMFLTRLDSLMQEPQTVERGVKVAGIANALEMINDGAMHGPLEYGWKKINNIKKK